MTRQIKLLQLGCCPYGQALAIQLALRAELQGDPTLTPQQLGYLICLEHPTTITLGKRGKLDDLRWRARLKAQDVPVFKVDRGGQATCHEPGQLVIYPILRLEPLGMGVVDLIRGMAAALADNLALWGLEADYDQQTPGLWTRQQPPEKIASVGMRVSGGVTTHGLAINLVNELRGFDLIIPCGMPEGRLTSLARQLQAQGVDTPAPGPLSVERFTQTLLPKLEALLDATLTPTPYTLPAPSAWEQPLTWDETKT
jgi:lipoyl(octanoyl) transferase